MTTSIKKRKGVSWLEYSLFSPFPELVHGVFLRHGGISKAPYHALNVSDTVGDDPKCVKKNFTAIQNALDLHSLTRDALDIHSLVRGKQIHHTTIREVEKGSPPVFEGCDGLITEEKGIGLLIAHADCQAALFYDPNKGLIGAAHAGWKGNVKRFYTKMVARFVARGSHPRNIFVCISPSLGPDHAEFKNYEQEFPPSFWPFQVKSSYFDLWAIAKRELLDAGIYENHIEIASICTYCSSKDFFSYRRDGITGRNGTVIALKS